MISRQYFNEFHFFLSCVSNQCAAPDTSPIILFRNAYIRPHFQLALSDKIADGF